MSSTSSPSRAAFWIGAAVVALIAWFARVTPAVFADPTSTREMRRIELLLATASTPERDEWFDERAPPTYFARLVAGAAQRWLAEPGGDPALRGVDEARLERLAIHATTVANVLRWLAGFLLVYVLCRGPHRAWIATCVVGYVAFAASRRGAAVDPRVLGEALACAGFALACLAARSGDLFDRVATALVAGALLGVGVACAPEAGALVAAAACALLAEALLGPAERAEHALVAGMAAFTVAGVLTFVQLSGLANLEGLPRATLAQGVLGVGVAFLLLRRFALKSRPRWLFGASVVPRVVVFAPALAWIAWAWTQWDVGVGLGDGRFAVRALIALALVVAAWRKHEVRGATCLAVLLGVAPLAMAGTGEAELYLALLLVLAVVLEPLIADPTRKSRWLPWAFFVPICVFDLTLVRERPTYERDAPRLVAFLRALRESTPSVGPWNHPSARPDARILCEPELGPALAYHARRAPLAAAQVGERASERVSAARQLLEGPTGGLVARLAASGATSALVGEATWGLRYGLDATRRAAPDVLHELAQSVLPPGLVVVARAEDPGFAQLVRWELAAPPAGLNAGK